MPLYIAMINWTDQGIKGLNDSAGRAATFKQLAQEMGCTVHGLFFTLGRYDSTARIEAPNEETVSALMLKLVQLGNVRSETMRAFTEEEFAAVMRKAGG